MLRSILVGLDGSAYSHAAIALALRWARRGNVLLDGIGIIDVATIRKAEPLPLGTSEYKHLADESHLAHAKQRVESLLDWFSRQCAQTGVRFRAMEGVGLPYEQIVLEAQRYDVVMLGQQTYFHFETQEGPGDTLHEVLRHSPRPVVTVPEKLGGGECVIVAYDGSVQAARTLQLFHSLGLPGSEQIHVISVNADQTEANRCANRAIEFLGVHDITAHRIPIASSDSPAQVILENVKQLNAGLIVMGAYGRPTWREFLFGSVTRQVLKESQVPVFLYH